MDKLAAVYVSHHSDEYINHFGREHRAELGESVCVVNSSDVPCNIDADMGFHILDLKQNVGFAAANNVGVEYLLQSDFDTLLVINPDVKLPKGWRARIQDILSASRNDDVGIFTVPLFGYDCDKDRETGLIDSLGIGHTKYGRWYDISQGKATRECDTGQGPYEIQAACGALMILSRDTVCELIDKYGYLFDESYFMYKEDIELSLRVRRLGKKIMLIPSTPAYHCRGWGGNRKDTSYRARALSARNEVRLHWKYFKQYLPYSIAKYLYVVFMERHLFTLRARFSGLRQN